MNLSLSNLGAHLLADYHISDEALSMSRIAYVLMIVLIIGIPYLYWLPQIPVVLFHPPLFLNLFVDRPPSSLFLVLLNLLLTTALTALLFGFHTRYASFATGILLLVSFAFAYSFGKIDHTILLILVPFVMAYSGWGNSYSIDSSHHRKRPDTSYQNANALFNLALLIGFLFFTAGISKWYGGWLRMDALAVKGHLASVYLGTENTHLLSRFFLDLDSFALWKIADYGTVFFECFFLLAVYNRKWFEYFTLMAILFHVLVTLSFNIGFIANIGAYFFFFFGLFTLAPERFRILFLFSHWRVMLLAWSFLLCYDIYWFYWSPTMPMASNKAPLKQLLVHFTSLPALWLTLVTYALLCFGYAVLLWRKYPMLAKPPKNPQP